MKWYDRWIIHPCAPDIVRSLQEQPDDWSVRSEYRLQNRRGLTIWIGNGATFCKIYEPDKVYLGLLGRIIVWRACKPHLRRWKEVQKRDEARRIRWHTEDIRKRLGHED